MDVGINTNNELKFSLMPQSGGKYCANNMTPTIAEYPGRPSQLELLGHSYPDPYYVGQSAYALQPLVYPHYAGLQTSRVALPLEIAEEPVYVNAKQYNGIMRRRQSRAKAEMEKKLIKSRKPYLHESRHLHAMRRQRSSGGRFANTKKTNTSATANPRPDESSNNSGTTTFLAHSNNTSSSGALLSHFSRNAESSPAKREVAESNTYKSNNMQQMFSCGNSEMFSSLSRGFQLSPYR
ncbi:hypothetical protein ACFE04_001311 [Oxalis oulophora]